jgi:hypothetical protein
MGKLYGSGRWSKLNVALNADLALARPINAMGMRAINVIADPACFYGSQIQFGAGSGMYSHLLSPLRNVGKGWFVAKKLFERGAIAKSLDGCPVL